MVALSSLHLFDFLHIGNKSPTVGDVHGLQIFPVQSCMFIQEDFIVLLSKVARRLLRDNAHFFKVYGLMETR